MSFYFEATPDSGIDDGTLSSSHDSLYDKSPLYRNLVNDITADGGKVEIYASGGRFSSAANAEGLTRPDPGLLNGVEIFISTTATADNLYVGTDGQPYPQTIERILAHEMFHAWQHITGKLSDIPYENESAAYKFENLIMQEAFNEEKMRLDDDGTNVNPVQEPSNSSNVNHYNDNGDKTNPELDPPDISSPVSDAAGHFNNAKDRGSPLVLDLDGDGIELSAFDQTNATFFDLDEDGEAEQTGWVDSDDGLLAVDANGNGEIDDNSELFGSMTEDGFSQLQAFDSNGDGVINASDADFEKLLVWQDLNQDGKSQEGELQTLSDWNITEIDLSATEVTVTQDGHDISHTSTFTMNGVTQDIKDVWFTHSTMNTVNTENYELDFAALAMPSSRGYGDLKAWHIAMSLDNTDTDNMLSQMQGLAAKTFDDLFTADSSIADDVRDVLFRWAGVDTVTAGSRGQYVDAQELAFLEAMTGQQFNQRGVSFDPLGIEAGYDLTEAFDGVFSMFYGRILSQMAGAELFDGDVYYDYTTDSMAGITGLDATKLSALETEATGLNTTAEKQVFWQNVVRMVDYSIGTNNLSSTDQTSLDTAITNSDATLDLASIVADIPFERPAGVTENGGTGDNTMNGSSGDDILNGQSGHDVIDGLAGDDIIYAGADNDSLTGGLGNDYIKGDSGNDIFNYNLGDGSDVYADSAGTDKIVFGAGISQSHLSFDRMGNTDLRINIDTGTQTGDIIIEDFFAAGGEIETLEFDADPALDLSTLDWALHTNGVSDSFDGTDTNDTIYGSAGNETIRGYAGNDEIYGEAGNDILIGNDGDDTLYGGEGSDNLQGDNGNNVLDAGAGNDRMSAGSGDDIYYYTSGKDTIEDLGGADVLNIGPSFTASQAQYFRSGADLIIFFDQHNSITIDAF